MLAASVRGVLARRTASALAVLGLLTATLGFVVLAATSRTTEATLVGDVGRAWNTPYDILVRPDSSEAPFERTQGLVRPNFLSATDGGITLAQLRAIRRLPGVQVAAPIAVAGIFYEAPSARIDLAPNVGDHGSIVAFRVTSYRSADAGLSRFPSDSEYVLFAPHGELTIDRLGHVHLDTTNTHVDCTALSSPQTTVTCFAPSVRCDAPKDASCDAKTFSDPHASVPFSQPVIVAGIDPEAESALGGIDRCTKSGRFFAPRDSVRTVRNGETPVVPVVVSGRTFIDESMSVHVDRATDPQLENLTALTTASTWVASVDRDFGAQDVYKQTVSQSLVSGSMWTPEDVTYDTHGTGVVAEVRPPNVAALLQDGASSQTATNVRDVPIPPDVRDSWFRSVVTHKVLTGSDGEHRVSAPLLDIVGQYDPSCVAGFDPLAGGRLEAYAPPEVRLADGRGLGPNASLAGYVNLPPTVLTTLDGILAFDNPAVFSGVPAAAPISAIRIRVFGVQSPSADARSQLSRVAAEIVEGTGLHVDIVKGASPRSIAVTLPAGRFGRPTLVVTEPWSVKGVGFHFVEAVSVQNLSMFGIVLVGGTLLVGLTSFTSVQRRRKEFGVLRALGWRPGPIAFLVEQEMFVLGISAGIGAVMLGLAIRAVGLGVQPWQLALAPPLAVIVALIAGLVPALTAARGSVVTVVRGRGALRRRRSSSNLVVIAARELRNAWVIQAVIGVCVVALGAALVGSITVVSVAFSGQLDTTRLGVDLSSKVQPFHMALALLTATVGAIGVAEIVTLGYMERRAHFAVLRGLGWPRRRIASIVGAQAVLLGSSGGVLGAIVTLVSATLLRASTSAALVGMGAAVGMAVGSTLLAALCPLVVIYRSSVAQALRGE